jgi:ankyrin repeat protein
MNNSFVCAAETGNLALCNILLENGAQINSFSVKLPQRTALMEATKRNNMQVLELLLSKGADVDKLAPNNECSALSIAASAGYADALKFLLQHGGNPYVQLKDSFTCLLEASKNGQSEVNNYI